VEAERNPEIILAKPKDDDTEPGELQKHGNPDEDQSSHAVLPILPVDMPLRFVHLSLRLSLDLS